MTRRNKVLQVCKRGKKKYSDVVSLGLKHSRPPCVCLTESAVNLFPLLTDDGVGWMESTFPKQSTRK